MTEASVKGGVLRHAAGYLQDRCDEGVWEDVLERLPEADQEILDGLVLTGGWYPLGTWNRLIRTWCEEHVTNSYDALLDLARYMADHDLNVIFKALLRIGTPGYVLRQAPSLWGRYYSVGEISVREEGERLYRVRMTAPVDEDHGPNRFVCTEGTIGWMTTALELTGAKHADVRHVRCRHAGAPACEYEVRW